MDLDQWQNYYKHHTLLIVQASSTNIDDAWMPFPIGMQFTYGKIELNKKLQMGAHDKLVPVSYTHLTLPTIYSV